MTAMRGLLLGVALTTFLSVCFASDYEMFVGDYTGMFIPVDREKGQVYDLSVSIREINDGLNISWESTTFDDGKLKATTYSIDFLETERKNILTAAEKKNLFGGRGPLDPINGEPYAWARITDRTLIVYMMLIADDGGYEVQTYNRTLKDNGDFITQYSRFRNGQVVRTLKATLNRQSATRMEKNK